MSDGGITITTYPDTHRTILTMFRISRRRLLRDNLPIGAKHGGREQLGPLFKALGFVKGAEIGSKKGDFAKVLCAANPDLHLTCIDPWDAGQPYGGVQHRHDRNYETAKKVLAPYNVTFLRKTSMNALVDIEDASLDFVYIDANHTFDYCCPDIIYWSQKVKPGGIVACHDYFHHIGGGVVRAVDAYTASHNITPWYVTQEVYPTAFWVKP